MARETGCELRAEAKNISDRIGAIFLRLGDIEEICGINHKSAEAENLAPYGVVDAVVAHLESLDGITNRLGHIAGYLEKLQEITG